MTVEVVAETEPETTEPDTVVVVVEDSEPETPSVPTTEVETNALLVLSETVGSLAARMDAVESRVNEATWKAEVAESSADYAVEIAQEVADDVADTVSDTGDELIDAGESLSEGDKESAGDAITDAGVTLVEDAPVIADTAPAMDHPYFRKRFFTGGK